jgi:hypothetical protein
MAYIVQTQNAFLQATSDPELWRLLATKLHEILLIASTGEKFANWCNRIPVRGRSGEEVLRYQG